MNSENVKLAWALVAGQLTHISKYRGVPRGRRPPAVCEACGGTVVMRIGSMRAPHFAHRPGSLCPLTAPETARHYNSKQLLASKLRSINALDVVFKCVYSRHGQRCTNDVTAQVARAWDTVRVEQLIHPIRPDIVLHNGDAPVLAIEVRATHAVPETKVTRLLELNIPLIEIAAGIESDEWVPGTLLPIIRHESKSADGLCPLHKDHRRSDLADQRNKESLGNAPKHPFLGQANEDLENHGDRWRFRVFDCYPVRGPRRRSVYWVYSTALTSGTYRLRLVNDLTSSAVSEIRTATKSDEPLKELHQRLKSHLLRVYEHVSSPMTWLDSSLYPQNPATIYREDYMRVTYSRNSEGIWVKSRPDV